MDKTPKILGIVGIALGALTSVSSTVGLVAQPVLKRAMSAFSQWADQLPQQPGQPRMGDLMDRTAEALEATRPYQLAQSGAMLALSVALLVIGIAMLQRRKWSRRAAMGWAVAALAFVPVMIWIQAFVIQPMTQEAVYRSMPQVPQAQLRFQGFLRSFQAASAAVGTVTFYAPFPVVLFALLKRKKSMTWFEPERDVETVAP
ncbi:MAG TPA: hypothetical protein VGK67_24575 [Myxococcales bacterium]|jgi:hypothetical protein